MKAAVYESYGGPEVLEVTEVDRPSPGEGQALVRVVATSINAADYRMMRADPFLVRLNNGVRRPKRQVLGVDVAGVVEAVGPGVGSVSVGDAVFGDTYLDGLGGFAEYAAVREGSLVPKPEGVSFQEAAAVPQVGITALQAARDRAAVGDGDEVLIQGAGGGVGTMLVQVLKTRGATVTAVCGPGSTQLVRSLGADRLVDYTAEDFTADAARYDAIFGVNGYRALAEYKATLAPGGTYVMVGGDNRQIFDALVRGRLRFLRGGKRIEVLTIDDSRRQEDLRELRTLLAAGQIGAVIDRVFPLDDIAGAFRYVEQGHVRGKVVVAVQPA